MQCINPLKASQRDDLSITYNFNESIRGLESFQFDCRKCLPCRLNQAREKAIRAFHESKMHPENSFLTLTYDDDHLESPRLIYAHIQTFMDSLRNRYPTRKISYMVTGEYGDKTKRPHWHLLLFNYSGPNPKHKYTTDHGERVYTSQELTDLWGKGNVEFGSLTMDSASYVARYAAKKLTHGKDQDHDYHPIHKTSSRYAIGRSWIEKYYKSTFDNGFVILPNGSQAAIPRYYVDWLKKYHPDLWVRYVTEVRPKQIEMAKNQQRKEELDYLSDYMSTNSSPRGRQKVKETILKSKFKKLQENLKL